MDSLRLLSEVLAEKEFYPNKRFLQEFVSILNVHILGATNTLVDACKTFVDKILERHKGLSWLYLEVNTITSWHAISMLINATVVLGFCEYNKNEHPDQVSALDKEISLKLYIEQKIEEYLKDVSTRKCTSNTSDQLY